MPQRDSENKYEKKQRQDATQWNFLSLLGDALGGFVSWSLLSNLPLLIFFYPCVKMGFTGWEAVFFIYFFNGLLGYKSVSDFAVNKPWILRLASIIGFSVFYVEDHSLRMTLGAFGMLFDNLAVLGVWLRSTKERRIRSIVGYLAGLLIYLAVRMWWFSLDPIDIDQRANIAAMVAAVIAAFLQMIDTPSVAPQPTYDAKSPSALKTGLGIGGTFFLTHLLYSEHAIIPRWTQVPTFPHGAVVILAVFIGIFLLQASFVNSGIWFGVGLVATILFGAGSNQIFPPIVEFIGGLILALYVISIWGVVYDQLAACPRPGRALLIGFIAVVSFHMWTVYTVAYKFMDPVFGVLLRERSVLLLFTALASCGFAHVKSFLPDPKFKNSLTGIHTYGKIFLVIIFLSSVVPSTVFRYHNSTLPPADPNPPQIKALAWAVHFGYDNNGRTNIPSLAKVIQENGVNVIGLVETDCTRTWIGNRDLVEYIGETLHFYTDFGPSTAQNTWGCGLISQFPIERVDRVILPSPDGELACLIDADIRVNGSIVNVIVSHFGNTEDELDRELQATGLSNILAKKAENYSPTFFLGYLTTDVMSEHYLRIVGSGRMQDTTNSFDRYCLYIIFRDLALKDFYRIDKGIISDTEAQVASLLIKPNVQVPPLTTAECRKIGNDHVKCGATPNCGICVFYPTRYCYEPELQSGCLALNGTWLGSSKDKTIGNRNDAKKFYDVQITQQSKDVSPLEWQPRDDSYIWTLNDFSNTWALYSRYNSAIFQSGDVYWRLLIRNMRGSLVPSNTRKIWLGIEMMGTFQEKVKATIDFSVVNFSDNSKTITKTISSTFTPETEAVGLNIMSVGDVWDGFYSGKNQVKIIVKVRDVEKQDF